MHFNFSAGVTRIFTNPALEFIVFMWISMTWNTRSINHIPYIHLRMTIFAIFIYEYRIGVLCFRLAHDDDLYVSGYIFYKKNVINIDDHIMITISC